MEKEQSREREGFRPAPFLTILDGTPVETASGAGRSRKQGRSMGSKLRKRMVRAGFHARETAQRIPRVTRFPAFHRLTSMRLPKFQGFPKFQELPRLPGLPAIGRLLRTILAGIASFSPKALLEGIKRIDTRKARMIPAILAFLILAAGGTSTLLGSTAFPVGAGGLDLPDEDSAQKALLAYLEPEVVDLGLSPQAPGGLPPIPLSVSLRSYTVKSGDSLDRIAKRFGLRQDTLISANNLRNASSIKPGVTLRIPNMDGISHKVRKGENLSLVAKAYGIDVTRLLDANDLASGTITVGQSLFIPNARLSSATLQDFYGQRFIWPASGRISSPFGYRANPFTGLRTFHSAIDIVLSSGTKVKATSGGRVADTGYNSVFGNYIILKHDSGYQSLYAHLSHIGIKEGAQVSQGSVIGLSGNTGQSTGPHLHFSIFRNGQAIDPLKQFR
jgi:murein DD-endopeptidase MepM/ murein hydrolase activator NlpD